jgi:hypothetical protein
VHSLLKPQRSTFNLSDPIFAPSGSTLQHFNAPTPAWRSHVKESSPMFKGPRPVVKPSRTVLAGTVRSSNHHAYSSTLNELPSTCLDVSSQHPVQSSEHPVQRFNGSTLQPLHQVQPSTLNEHLSTHGKPPDLPTGMSALRVTPAFQPAGRETSVSRLSSLRTRCLLPFELDCDS